ncbi:VCBS repeat-containing protein [Aquimarina sp. 2304DJ70-9]|uniref:VCBS repeat-containing protein n=1 Tax=Aquimarina penaris TaxID=3231044 RepID=UPI00346291FC
MRKHIYMLLFILTFGCSEEKKEGSSSIVDDQTHLFEKLSETHTNIYFKNTVSETLYFNFLNYSYIYNGGGIAVGDINNDGLEDVYFGSNQESNKLYLNKGNFIFEDITQRAGVLDDIGWTTGVSMIDINADGWLDIYVCKSGSLRNNQIRKNKLYINQKNGTFIEQAKLYGLDSEAFSTQAYYFDFDKDEDLDIYLVNHRPDFNNNTTVDPRIQLDIRPESTDQLFENVDGVFKDITSTSGILNKAWGLSASIGDFNEDGWPDVYVANDFLEPDLLYINNGNSTFTNRILEFFDHISANSMGSDYADINNDLKPDLVVLDMLAEDHQRSKENMATMSTENFNHLVASGYHHQYMSNMLQLNLGKGIYSEIGQLTGIAKTDWSWAPLLADFNNDGFNDLFVTNGIEHDLSNQDFRNQMKTNIRNRKKVSLEEAISMMPSTKLQNKIFANNGNYSFQPITKEWGLQQKVNSNGVAYADLDNDGDLDLILNNQSDLASIYKNNQSNHFISFSLLGKKNNPNAIGAKVNVYAKDLKQAKELYTCRGFQSSVTNRLYFGLGNTTHIDSIHIQWPKGALSILNNVISDQNLIVPHPNKQNQYHTSIKKTPELFTLIQGEKLGITYKNNESIFDDYSHQLLLPQKQSEKGAALAVADVNNDDREDFFAGNAKGASAALYLQNKNGTFSKSNTKVFENDINLEDNKALFFDIDADGDQDLYIATGSYEDIDNSSSLQDRIYINDGKGNFSKKEVLPQMTSTSNAIATTDFDKDGDLDLFIGGGVIPGKYPLSSPSYLLKNENGKFIDVTNKISEGFDQLRMVNDAVFSDYDNDGDNDLLIAGEWMPICIFENEDGIFTRSTNTKLDNYIGWYFNIQATDIDQDGDMDYLVGNLGQNNKFHPNQNKPLHIYAKDFDDNGSFDIILSKEAKDGILLPIRGKECSSEQIPKLTQKFKTYKEFASASLIDIYGNKDLKEATHYSVTNFSSILIINKGDGNLDIRELPKSVQFGPTTDFLIADFNADGHNDIFGIGSLFEAEVETIRYDASKGYFLFGNTEKDSIKWSSSLSANLKGLQTKAAELITINGEEYILLLSKNSELKLINWDFE